MRLKAAEAALAASAAAIFALGLAGVEPFTRWSITSLVLAVGTVVFLFLRFEEGRYGSKDIAVIGSLSALGAAGRVLFAAVPGVQPATFLTMMGGYVFGSGPGFVVGVLVALISNTFLGHGPWTPWQMLAWGLAGAAGGLLGKLGRRGHGKAPFVVLCTAWGFLFGWMMNLWFWLSFIQPLSLKSFLAVCASSFWMDLFHAVGNLAFALFLTVPVSTMLERFKGRFAVEYVD
jgi:energy-coupling factor transport system substrate-specific component